MQLTLGDVISLVTRLAGRSDFSASEVSQWANMALTEVSSRLHYKPKEALALSNVTGDGDERRIQVPSDFDYSVGLKFYSSSTDADTGANVLGDAFDLDIADTTVIDSFSSTSGTPMRYAIYAGYIELDPIPDSRGSLILRYAAKQPELITSAQTPALDERWHQAWLWKTTELTCLARSDRASAQEFERKYVNYMVSTPNDRQQEQMAKKGQSLWVRKA